MLTPMHVQYLIGLCCLRRTPDAVDVTLGDMLYDPAAEIDRDVDITVTCKTANGDTEAIAGYEVKKESEPLDVTKIEQLCTKFSDIPSLSKRAVVSASGYSAAAVKKAAAHGIELYEFVPWEEAVQSQFSKMSLSGTPSESILFSNQQMVWLDRVGVRVNPSAADDRLRAQLTENPQILDAQGDGSSEYKDLDQLVRKVLGHAALQISKSPDAQAILLAPRSTPPNEQPDGPLGNPLTVQDVLIDVATPVFIRVDDALVAIQEVLVSGQLQWLFSRRRAAYQVMRLYQGSDVYAGAAISEVPGKEGALLAMLLSPTSSDMMLSIVNLPEKHKNMIRRLKLRSRSADAAKPNTSS